MTFIRNPYNYDREEVSRETGLDCTGDPGYTRQEFKEEADINTLVERFGLGMAIPEAFKKPTYGDFTGVDDFHSAANAIAQAHETFDSLPAYLRDRFQNDPGRFVDYCSDERNTPELIKLGLLLPDGSDKPAPELPKNTPAPGSPAASQHPTGQPGTGSGAPGPGTTNTVSP